jgi:hypothetical protein
MKRLSDMRLSRKRIGTLALAACLALLAFTFTFALPSSALAWDNCPKGLVNDPYPGACRRYVDTNGDGICDLSQSEPVQATTTTTEVVKEEEQATTTTAAVVTSTSGEPPTGDCPLGPCANCGACLGISSIVSASTGSILADENADEALTTGAIALAAADSSATTSTTSPSSGSSGTTGDVTNDVTVTGATQESSTPVFFTYYNVSPIAIAFFIIYGVSFILHKAKRIRLATHRKVWNVLLAATFLITGIFGLILTIQLDYELPFTIPFDLLFWHVEAGVAMTLISLFHLSWHFNYYRNVFRRSRKAVREARAAEKARDTQERRLAWEARAQRRAHTDPRRTSIRPRGEVEPEL